MTSEQAAPAAFGIAGAASRLEALLDDNLSVPETPMVPTRVDETDPATKASKMLEAEAKEAEPVQETKAEEPAEEAETEATEQQEASSDEQEPQEAKSETEPYYTVKIDGKEERVPLSELLNGFSRQSDYTRKTQALAAERKTFEAEAEKIKQERVQYAQLLPALQKQLQDVPEPDWQRLYSENPDEFVRQKALWDMHKERLQAVQSERVRVESELVRENQRIREQKAEEGRKALFDEFPQWKSNTEQWEKDRLALVDRLYKRHNLNDQEVGVITLYPTILADMQKARLYDQMMTNKPKPVAQKSPVVAKPGSSATAPRPQNETTRAKQRLAKTGKLSDAAAIFETMIE